MSLYNDVEVVLAKDLGPAAPMFLKRQVGHLKKDSTSLMKQDLDELANWCFRGVKLTLGEATALRVKNNVISLK
jgi:hypothetical protein